MKKLIDMTPAERAEIVEAWMKGEQLCIRSLTGADGRSAPEALNNIFEYALPPKFELDWSAVHPDVTHAESVTTSRGHCWVLLDEYGNHMAYADAFVSFRADPNFRGRVGRP